MLSAAFSIAASTVGTSEYSVTNDSTTVATNSTDAFACVVIDPANVAAGDEFEVAYWDAARSGGTARRTVLGRIVPQGGLWVSEFVPVLHAWDFTIKKISGTDRAFDASILIAI